MSVPIEVKLKKLASSFALMPEKPPAELIATGSRIARMPMVLMTNWAMSVSVIDHMPPSTE